MSKKALLIGNSDGIGLATTKRLLKKGWEVTGISRSRPDIDSRNYSHTVKQVQEKDYGKVLKRVVSDFKPVDLCIYFVGIGRLVSFDKIEQQVELLEINLMGMVKTTSVIIPHMMENGAGHFIGISSMADVLLDPNSSGYHASKAGFSTFLEGLGLAIKPKNIDVTNIRFGFVDTKMARGSVKPFMMSPDKAVDHIMKCLEKKPVSYSAPRLVMPLVKLRALWIKLLLKFK
ncbi:MAG: SDR family NAD(P)-dependent oxidoreductase [Elusimicrobiota bacterium]